MTAQPVLDLAATLNGEGRFTEALVLCDHLLASDPSLPRALQLSAEALGALGDCEAALERIVRLENLLAGHAGLILTEANRAIQKTNALLHAGDIEAAGRLIELLTVLCPNHISIYEAALSINLALKRPDLVAKAANALVHQSPTHLAAHRALADLCLAADDSEGEIRHLLILAQADPGNLDPALRALGVLLCGSLDPARIALVERLVRTAQATPTDTPWQDYYKASIGNIDAASLLAPAPTEPGPLPAAPGESGLVFLVAADPAYIIRHARNFIRSVLKNADVPLHIVVHVIGGAHRLEELTAIIGIDDPRVSLTGDAFDGSVISERTVNPPTNPDYTPLAAHYQTARFFQLERVLARFGQPVIVSDIDVVLERGVKDLLTQHDGMDVVFNEAPYSRNFGGRFPAGLLLVRPTAEGFGFVRFFEAYLRKQLAKPLIGANLDQTSLLMARHRLLLGGRAKLASFDELDINKTVYKRYGKNPYRFFSFYSGFEEDSYET